MKKPKAGWDDHKTHLNLQMEANKLINEAHRVARIMEFPLPKRTANIALYDEVKRKDLMPKAVVRKEELATRLHESWDQKRHLERRIRALRGVITRMKRRGKC